MHEGFRRLMSGCEELFALLRAHDIAFWVDWGTLLGLLRHRNVIPWDYDADLCLLEADYARVLGLFARHGGRIGSLSLDPDAYGNREGCCSVAFADWDPDDLGIDLVAYRRERTITRSLMTPQVIAAYPGDYDFVTDDLFPLRQELLLGGLVGAPRRLEERVVHLFGEGWRSYPEGESASAVTAPPFVVGAGLASGATETWWLTPAGLAPSAVTTFTDLLFADDLRRWGHVTVVTVPRGERPDVPPGWWAQRARA